MTDFIQDIRASFADRENDLDVFEIFSGTETPGENGNPDINDPDGGISISDASAIATLSSLGLTGISYGLMKYSETNPARTVVDAMKPLYEKIQLGKALEAAQEGKTMTKLMEFLPYVGVGVKRLNIDAIWEEVTDILKIMQLEVDRARLAIEPVDNSMDRFHDLSTKAFYGFGGVTLLGAAVTTATSIFHDRAVPLLDEFDSDSDSLDSASAAFAEIAFSEVEYRADKALGEIDSRLAELATLVDTLPDFNALVGILSEGEKLFEPIQSIAANVSGLVKPYEAFLDIANVIGAPIDGVLSLFENPPKILPKFKTITGEYIWVPDPTLKDPFRVKKVWVEFPIPIIVPDGFAPLFSPIPRSEVQKIIDLIIKIAGLPKELLEKALSPILSPIQAQIDKIMQPIIEKINPFDDYLDDFTNVADLFKDLSEKLTGLIDEIQAVAARLQEIELDISAIKEVGAIDPNGMATYFGTDADEILLGVPATDGGGFLNGAILHGNGGNDTITGSELDDLLSGGSGDDVIRGEAGNDLLMGGTGRDDMAGGAGNDILIGGTGNDRLAGDAGDDRIFGNAGNDRIIVSTGDDVVDGGAGYDIAEFLNASSTDFTVTAAGQGVQLTRTMDGGTETQVFRKVEEFQFDDQSMSLAQLLQDPETAGGALSGSSGGGTSGDDPDLPARVEGGNTDDLIAAGVGRVAFLKGGGGADVFEFKAETKNGTKDIDVVEDFSLNEDMVRLSQSDVSEVRQTGGGLMLVLKDDGDAIYLRNADLDLQDLGLVFEAV